MINVYLWVVSDMFIESFSSINVPFWAKFNALALFIIEWQTESSMVAKRFWLLLKYILWPCSANRESFNIEWEENVSPRTPPLYNTNWHWLQGIEEAIRQTILSIQRFTLDLVTWLLYKKAIDCGVYCCNKIIDLYDKGFHGQEPRSYWVARYERLQRAVARYSAYLRLTLEEVSGADKDTSATQSVSASPVDGCSSITSYYKTSEKKDQKGKSSWFGILVLIAAIVFAIKLIF